MAKYLDMNGLTYLWEQIKARMLTKVDKVDGKDLSTNDYTTEEKNKLTGIEEGANKYIHPTSGVETGDYTKVTVDINGHITSGSNPTTLNEYGITDAANIIHNHTDADIISLDATKLTGTIDIARLPVGALERLVVVATDLDRFSLTINDVQKGDTVKVNETGLMYFVIDDTQLTVENGYEQYTAGSATSVDWSGITGKPSEFIPSIHTHILSDITNFPTTLKNPTALSLNINGTTTSYDGSNAVTITIDESALGIAAITNTEIDEIIV